MAKKLETKPKDPKKDQVVEDDLPIVEMDECECFDPSAKKLNTEEQVEDDLEDESFDDDTDA